MPTKKKAVKRTPTAQAVVLTEQEKILIHLTIKHGEQEAASQMGLKPDQVRDMMRRRPVQAYMIQYRHAFITQMARHELNQITQMGVTREGVLGRLMSLALTPPDETKGSIEGQVQALSTISDIMGFKFTARNADDFFRDKTPTQLFNYARYGKFDPTAEEKKAVDAGTDRAAGSK